MTALNKYVNADVAMSLAVIELSSWSPLSLGPWFSPDQAYGNSMLGVRKSRAQNISYERARLGLLQPFDGKADQMQ